ncbi:MAG TPA: GTPase [Symbiobacteriaceae bacterium]|nr:GTPase [Symbiobacteriaceae bacterium]
MPIPHQEMKRIIKRRIIGIEGTDRIHVLKELLKQFPGYYSGPYGELRKWVQDLIEEAQRRRGVKHQDQFFVPKEGAAQVVLVGPPNAGKSSLLKALTGRQVAVGDYPFTTLRPVAGMVKVGGAVVQLVDLPGLLDGAVDGKGGGRALLGCVRQADAALFVAPLTPEGVADSQAVFAEVTAEAEIDLPFGLVGTKADLPGAAECWAEVVASLAPGVPVVRCSVAAGEGLEEVQALVWSLCGLKRVYCRPRGKGIAAEPVVLGPAGTVEEFVSALNRAWIGHVAAARVAGPSVRFAGQSVGMGHVLADGDVVELVLR